MDPKIWGPHQWFMMHVISFTYPEQPSQYDKRAFHDYYASLKDVLPCEACKKHYNTFFMQHPIGPHLDKRMDLIKWVVDIHNYVNINLDKPTYSVEEVLIMYKNLNPVSPFIKVEEVKKIEKNVNQKQRRLYLFLIIASLIIVFSIYYFNRYYFFL